MIIIRLNKENLNQVIKKTAEIIKNGGLVVFPSDTVYGLLVDATNSSAVNKLIEFKNRPPGKPISVFVENWLMLEKLVSISKKQRKILKEILPGQFTVILNSKHKVTPLLESEKKTLGVRLINYLPINKLLKIIKKPLTATSANLSGKLPHHSINSFLKSLPKSKEKLIDLIVDAGKLPRNRPSTVISLAQTEIKILRQGDIPFLKNQQTFISYSEEQTKKIGQKLCQKILKEKSLKKPLIIILKGELGSGKTTFIKGIAKNLKIDNIISPSFVIYYEYPIKNTNKFINFYHFDFYQVEEKEELQHLKVEKLLKPKNILVFEWGEKVGQIFSLIKQKGDIILIEIKYLGKDKRKIIISESIF